jgi:hypothetical protein
MHYLTYKTLLFRHVSAVDTVNQHTENVSIFSSLTYVPLRDTITKSVTWSDDLSHTKTPQIAESHF